MVMTREGYGSPHAGMAAEIKAAQAHATCRTLAAARALIIPALS
jgi:hypothetical protein